jgi:hypothetical protein
MTLFVAFVFFLLVATGIIAMYRKEDSLKNIFLPAFFVKSLAGMCVGLVYVFHYKVGDTLVFFNDGVQLAELARHDLSSYLNFVVTSEFASNTSIDLVFTDHRALFMVKIVSFLSLVSVDNYWLISFYITLPSFFAAWYLAKQIHQSFSEATGPAVVAFLFFPSIIFWTSGVIKETIAMASLYFISGIFIRVWCRQKISVLHILITLIAVYLAWNLKYYFAGIFFAVVFATLIYRLLSLRFNNALRGARSYFSWIAIFIVLIAAVTFLHPNFKAQRVLKVMVQNYEEFHRFSRPENLIYFYDLGPTVPRIILNSPKALFAGLFRPLFFDANNFLGFLISIENIFLLTLALIALRSFRKLFSSPVSVLLCAIVVYVILLAIFITLSTPNLGTLARYRVGYLPFFVFLVLLNPAVAIRLQRFF